MSERPVVRLLPKTDPRPFRFGVPWVYGNQMVLDRRTKGLDPGTLVILEDADRRPLGLGAINPGSKIAVRLLDTDPEAEVDADWIRLRLSRDKGFNLQQHSMSVNGLPAVAA